MNGQEDETGLTFVIGGVLTNVHPPSACAGRHCWVHDPSDHPLRGAPVSWREDKAAAERVCPHGIGHPDPDDLAYHRLVGRADIKWLKSHACDGCCAKQVVDAALAADEIAAALDEGDDLWAFKMVLQTRDHLRPLLDAGSPEVASFRDAPDSCGSLRWDTLLAAVIGHEFVERGLEPPAWTDVAALEPDWILDHPRWDEAAIKARTPAWLAAYRIFVDANDLVTA